MTRSIDWPSVLSIGVVALCWVGFALILVVGKKQAERSTKERDYISHIGFFLQCVAYAICFVFPRPFLSPLVPMPKAAEILCAIFTILVAVASTWFCLAAARALGRHWALVARVIEGHRLVRTGPYAVVRNPIYVAMLGMLVATGMAISRWPAISIALGIFFAGTVIRIRSEEKLLRAALGAEFAEYAAIVPAFLPRFFALK